MRAHPVRLRSAIPHRRLATVFFFSPGTRDDTGHGDPRPARSAEGHAGEKQGPASRCGAFFFFRVASADAPDDTPPKVPRTPRRRAGTWANTRWARAIYDICAATPSMTQSRSSKRCSSWTTGSAPASDAGTLDVPPGMNYGTACGIVVQQGTNSTTAAGRPEGRFARERNRMPHGDAEHRHGMRRGKGRRARAPCAQGEHDVARRDAGTPSRDATPTRGPHRMPRRIAGRRDTTRRLCASPSEPI